MRQQGGFQVEKWSQGEVGYPKALEGVPTDLRPDPISSIGDIGILDASPTALFCSVKCPGSLILLAYDLAQALREANITIISGFHSPIEKECLLLLLRGKQPVVVCPARSISGMRIPTAWKSALDDGRLLVISPFGDKQRRMSVENARLRNRFVAALAKTILVIHASRGGVIEKICREVSNLGKPIYALDDKQNSHLMVQGAKLTTVHDAVHLLQKHGDNESNSSTKTLRHHPRNIEK